MDNKPVNIRVSTDEIPHNDRGAPTTSQNVYENFLITTNTDYRSQIQQLQSKLSEVERERDDFEVDNDKIENSQRYMRGILKNYYEIDQYNADIKLRMAGLLSSTNTISSIVKISIGILCAIVAATIATVDHWMYIIPPLFVLSFVFVQLYEYIIANPAKELETFMTKASVEIDTIKKTNALLPDLFDNL